MSTARSLPLEGTLPAQSPATGRSVRDHAAMPRSADATMVHLVRRGDSDAIERLVRENWAAIFGFLRARVIEHADAEDLCQDVFLRCLKGKEKIPADLQLRFWLYGIARNVLREYARSCSRRKEVAWTQMCLELETYNDEPQTTEVSPVEFLPGCLEALGPSAKEALSFQYRQRLTVAAIATKLCRSEGAVKLLLHRARQAVRNCLNRRMRQETDG